MMLDQLTKRIVAAPLVLSLLISFGSIAQGRGYELPSASTPVSLGHDTKILKEISSGLNAIAESSKQALVFVSVSKTIKGLPPGADPFELFGFGFRQMPDPKQEGLGSGFFIDIKRGLVLTNNHVIDGADEITLKLSNGENQQAKVVGVDPKTDVAVVEIVNKKFNRSGLASLILGDSEKLAVGSLVVALGAPFGLEASISFGTVSALGRGSLQITQLGDFIQTDAAINPGNSGGPLVDMEGKVIGINTAIFSKSGGYNGIGFAVPADLVREVSQNIINGMSQSRGFIGVHFQHLSHEMREWFNLSAADSGVVVVQVAPGGPAEKAGIFPKDLIIAVDDKKIEKDRDLVNRIGLMKPGKKTTLTLLREGKELKKTITIGVFPGSNVKEKTTQSANSSKETLGVEFKFSDEGLEVSRVDKISPARRSLREGDLILSVDRTEINSSKGLDQALLDFKNAISKARASKQKSVLMRIKRAYKGNESFAFVTVEIL